MSRYPISRRQFLTLPPALLLLPLARAWGAVDRQAGRYQVEVGLLYGALRFDMTGTITEEVDRGARRYTVTMAGEGSGLANHVESAGTVVNGRWAPVQSRSRFVVRGRESRSDITYDHARRAVEYHFRGETFFWRRLRVVDDVIAIPEGVHVDDAFSATLNYVDERWRPGADGALWTHVIRRRRNDGEGPDDVEKAYRAELVPFVLRVAPDPSLGQDVALIDMTRFSSWARVSDPARIVFGRNRRPQSIASSLILGTSVNIRLAPP